MSLVGDNSSSDQHMVDQKSVEEHHTIHLDDEKKTKSRGIKRIEKVRSTLDSTRKGKILKWMFFVSIFICAYASSLDSSTTYNYQPFATSYFQHHSMLSTLSIATSIISAVAQPFIAKISDITSRPISYIVVLVFYVIGDIIIASSTTISAYIVGSVFKTIGNTGIDLLNTILIGDMTSLQWRGIMQAVIASPSIVNTWIAGYIVDHMAVVNWRWGYGMFAIIMPVVVSPAIAMMFYLDHNANKHNEVSFWNGQLEVTFHKGGKKDWKKIIWTALIEIDALGLIVMGFGWSLLLLPFSLYTGAQGGYSNPSLIAMFVVGGILLIAYSVYEIWYCPFPSMPKRVFNRTFIGAVIIDIFYELGGYIRILYLSSYALVVTEWSLQNWTYWDNTLTMGLCVFAYMAGGLQRYFHRYKYIQFAGICILIIGNGIMIRNHSAATNTASLVMTQVLCGWGGSFSVIGSQVSSQASVPHQDMSLAISVLSLWTSIGAGIGSAIGGSIWASKLPGYLREFMPASVSDEQVLLYFGDVNSIRALPWGSPERNAGIRAYQESSYYMFTVGLGLYFICLIASLCQKDLYLGENQNAVETASTSETEETITEDEESSPANAEKTSLAEKTSFAEKTSIAEKTA